MKNIFFFQTQQIQDNTVLLNEFKQQNIFYSYFQVEKNYYLFVYAQQSIDINLLYQSVDVIQELDSKQRKIRSLRGFFLYALEIIENGKDYEILETNLQPFFWRKFKNIIRQNKKAALQEFLFELHSTEIQNDLKNKIESLENQVNSLQQKVIQLETKFIREPLQPLESSKTIQQGLEFHHFGKDFRTGEDLGFQRQAEGKISLKKYYESTETHSLFQLKGYNIKYESIRRTNFFKQFRI